MQVQNLDWLIYIYNLTRTLASSYQDQLSNTEDYSRWNLPGEIGEDWTGAEDMEITSNLQVHNVLPENAISMLNQIVRRFNHAFDLPAMEMNNIYSHEAMQTSTFWKEQRETAQMLLPILEENIRRLRTGNEFT